MSLRCSGRRETGRGLGPALPVVRLVQIKPSIESRYGQQAKVGQHRSSERDGETSVLDTATARQPYARTFPVGSSLQLGYAATFKVI
jgi:hypothetical protein